MVGHQSPGKTWCLGILYQIAEAFHKIISVSIIGKYKALFDPPCHDMMQGSFKIYARLSGHAQGISLEIGGTQE